MNRAQFFQGIFALVGFGQGQTMTTGKVPISHDITGGSNPYCEPIPYSALKEGEERCPLGHAQKPRWVALAWRSVNEASNPAYLVLKTDLFVNVCATCGIVYVKQEKK